MKNKTEADLVEILESQSFQFAKSMPKIPHWYTLRDNWNNDAKFDNAVSKLREFGYNKVWGKTTYRYFDANGYHYWTMGARVSETILINRAHKKYTSNYNQIANKYDDLYKTDKHIAENIYVQKQLYSFVKEDKTILDIGCGTGLALDLFKAGENFTGIDLSHKMLQVLKDNHKDCLGEILCSSFEDYFTTKKHDGVISLFGSPSYIRRDAKQKLIDMCEHSNVYLMFYKNGYKPSYEQELDIDLLDENDVFDIASGLKADMIDYNNYIVVSK